MPENNGQPRPRWHRALENLAVALVTLVTLLLLYEALSRATDQGSLPGVALAHLADEQTHLTVQDVDALPESAFEPSTEAVALGYSSAARWFRVQLPAGLEETTTLIVQPSYLDDVQIFVPDPARPQTWTLHQQGDHFAYSLRERKLLSFAADLGPNRTTAGAQHAYVRVQTRNAHNIRIRLLSDDTARTENALTLVFVGLYCGVVLVLAAASVLSAAIHRDRFWAANALFQIATLATMFFYFGLSNQFLFPHMPAVADTLSVLCGFLQYFFGSLFYRLLYRIYGAPRWVLGLQTLSLLILPAQLVLMAFGRVDLALQFYSFSLPFTLLLAAGTVYALRASDRLLLNLLRINMISTVVFFALLWAIHIGLKPSGFMQLYPGVFINLLTAIMLHLVMLRRRVLDEREREQAQLAMNLTEQQFQLEKAQREEDKRFLAMLLHEMRSPLSVINVALHAVERKVSQALSGDPQGLFPRKDLGRIRQASVEMKDVLQQVQMSTELEHRRQQGLAWTTDEVGACAPMTVLRAMLQTEPHADRLHLSADPADDADAVWVQCSEQLLLMMVGNLVGNALKYAPAGSPVRLRVQVREPGEVKPERQGQPDQLSAQAAAPAGAACWVLQVENEPGPAGRPDPQRVFAKYYRAPKAHRFSGTGLGLYVVHGMARMLGGDLQYHPEAPGVVFTLSLPLAPPGYDARVSEPLSLSVT